MGAPSLQEGASSDSESVRCFALSWPEADKIFAATASGQVYRTDISVTGSPLELFWTGADLSFSVAAAAGTDQLLLGDTSGRLVLLKTDAAETVSSAVVWQAHEHRVLAVW